MIVIRLSSNYPMDHSRILHSIRTSVRESGYKDKIKIGRIKSPKELESDIYDIGLIFGSNRYSNRETTSHFTDLMLAESEKSNIDAVFEINGSDGKVFVNALYVNGIFEERHNAILKLPDIIKRKFS